MTNWADNFSSLIEYVAAAALQPPFIYFIGVIVIAVIVYAFLEVIR